MRMLFLICESSTTLEKLKSLLENCSFVQSVTLTEKTLSINHYDKQGQLIEYIGIETENSDNVIDEYGEDSEAYKEFYCNKDIINPSVFWIRYSLATSNAYLLTSLLKCLKDSRLSFLVNNGCNGNFQVDEFIQSVMELI
jgi:hypothetical protein